MADVCANGETGDGAPSPSCPGCGGVWPEADRRDLIVCPECRSDAGRFAELRIAWHTVQNGSATPDLLNRIAEWPGIQHYACELFGHPVFSADTWNRLECLLTAEHAPDRNAMLRLPLVRVLDLLRNRQPATPTEGEGKAGTRTETSEATPGKTTKRKRGRPADTDPKQDKRIYEAWKTGQHQTQVECDTALSLPAGSTYAACERHRKRLERRNKRRRTK